MANEPVSISRRSTLEKMWSLTDWKYTRIYNPQRRLRVLVERCRKDSSQVLEHEESETIDRTIFVLASILFCFTVCEERICQLFVRVVRNDIHEEFREILSG
ncbi:hypothetical protein TNCV_3120911 [Trichonephila clavipes]|nr:hypothetical protein TNCV_3120911 [Trichonephila clavipes]